MTKADELLIRIFKATYPEYFTPSHKMIRVRRDVKLDDDKDHNRPKLKPIGTAHSFCIQDYNLMKLLMFTGD